MSRRPDTRDQLIEAVLGDKVSVSQLEAGVALTGAYTILTLRKPRFSN
jgi:hypothetical protein